MKNICMTKVELGLTLYTFVAFGMVVFVSDKDMISFITCMAATTMIVGLILHINER